MRVNCQKSYVAGVTISTSFGSLPAGGKCYNRTVATLCTARENAAIAFCSRHKGTAACWQFINPLIRKYFCLT